MQYDSFGLTSVRVSVSLLCDSYHEPTGLHIYNHCTPSAAAAAAAAAGEKGETGHDANGYQPRSVYTFTPLQVDCMSVGS